MRCRRSVFMVLSLGLFLPACEPDDKDSDGTPDPADCDDEPVIYEGDVGEAEIAGLCADGCARRVTGSVTLDATALTDLDELSCVTEIGGDLLVRQNEALSSIAGLAALTTVGGDLSVGEYTCTWTDQWECVGTGNPALTSYDGLQGLVSVGGWLSLADNDAVVEPGVRFEHLTSIGPSAETWLSIMIGGHAALTTVPDFPLITDQVGITEVWGNDALVSLAGFSSFQQVESLLIAANPALESPLGLGALTQSTGSIVFAGNGIVSLYGLEALEAVGGALEFWDNDAMLSYEGLNNLASIGYWMQNIDNDALTDLRGLDALRTVGMDFNVMDNDALVSVDGVESLTTIDGHLQIMGYQEAGNPLLVDLGGLYGLETVAGDVTIKGNATLPDAEAWALVNQIESVGGAVTVEDNGG